METQKVYTLVTKKVSDIVNIWRTDPEVFTGVEIRTIDVFSICTGRVIEILNNSGIYIVTVQFSSKLCFRYCNLKSVVYSTNSIVRKGSLIGKAHDTVKVECITTSESIWPVRVGSLTYYKEDPMKYISGETECLSTLTARVIADKNTEWPQFVFDKYTDAEFRNGRGE